MNSLLLLAYHGSYLPSWVQSAGWGQAKAVMASHYWTLLAQAEPLSGEVAESGAMPLLGRALLLACVFSALGIVVLAASFWVFTKLMPFSVLKEIEEDQNVALAILMSSVVIGISLIVSASILG